MYTTQQMQHGKWQHDDELVIVRRMNERGVSLFIYNAAKDEYDPLTRYPIPPARLAEVIGVLQAAQGILAKS